MEKRVEAYLSDWAFHQDLRAEQAQHLTHVNYSFGHVVDGKVDIAHLQQRSRLERVQRDFPQLQVNLSVGGWGAEGFSDAVKTEESREAFAQSAICVVRELNLSGIDWDWEYPTSDAAGIKCDLADAENMTAFLLLMRQKLDALTKETGRSYEQSIAVGADRVKDYIWEDALPALDTVNLMTYDMGMGEMAGHVTNLYPSPRAAYSAAQSAADFMAAGVPKEKLLIGAAFYFHAYEGVDNACPLGKGKAVRLHNLSPIDLKDGWEARWDEEARAMYYVKGNRVLTGDDARSLQAKRRFIEEQGLAGIIIWELNHDRENQLLPHLAKK